MFGKASFIITIVLLSYSACGILFLFVLRMIKNHKRNKAIKEEQNKPLVLEASLYDCQEKIECIEK